jgi:hypothetical protein
MERPDYRNVLTTVVALIYLAFLTSPFFVPDSFLHPIHVSPQRQLAPETQISFLAVGALIFVVALLASAWLYLIRDLIHQVSLFFRKNRR